jgi:hypothetical protein
MIYLVEINDGAGKMHIRQYDGPVLWDVIADAEADITNDPCSRIMRVWPLNDAPAEILAATPSH